ncbi:hypothetical protein [Planctomyces sp. SH-PL62]|uniref:hypothetical protein n=1 Tax=Planctomyces sp. SH-PL62 TaxID=1636152 RepID=UPI00078B8823|nr:hypothetical protein [Planctomyces sp. SH-PL62]AMV37365.1 hypothetical protein VT85_08020 [Planctomyces sp. SH-PL62]
MPTSRERDVRGAIRDILDATGAFDAVYTAGLPEDRGERSGDRLAAAVEPGETRVAGQGDDVSGALAATSHVTLVLLARDDDPAARDDQAERLLHTAAAALNGRSLAGSTLPGSTRIRSWAWRKPIAPERRIEAILEFQYLVEGWNAFDFSE